MINIRLYFIVLSLFICDMANATVKHKKVFNDEIELVVFDNALIEKKGFFEISVSGDTMIFKLTGFVDKRPSVETLDSAAVGHTDDYDLEEVVQEVRLEPKDTALYKYVRESILHYFYYKDMRKYEYYKPLGTICYRNPEPPSISVYIFKNGGRLLSKDEYSLPSDIYNKKPQMVTDSIVVYTDEYARFLDTLLYLDRNYSSDNEATTGDNEY